LAYVHACLPADAFATALADWNFEAELLQSAGETLELLETAARQEEFTVVRRTLPAVRRVVAALPALRRQLVAAERTATVLHGDAHSGNVMIRRRGTSREAVLFDWGRTRLGSPLEDVSSWLQALGYWEPEVRRAHDTLLRHYLAARGRSTQLDQHLRALYWLAGACNGLAGALRHHLLVAAASADRQRRRRAHGVAAVRDWLRIIRRADAHWRY
jgi:aminoglycoside phosphotransferase (APT) family kinase protein